MVTVAISSGCFGFSNRLAADVAATATDELGVPIGVEIVVPRWGVPRAILAQATSAHYPIQIRWDEKWAEKLWWDTLFGGPRANPTPKTGLPMVVHTSSWTEVLASGYDFCRRRFSGKKVWLENTEEGEDPVGDVLKLADASVYQGVTSVACYDVGHAALHGLQTGHWSRSRSLVDNVLLPDLTRYYALRVAAAHIHNVDLGAAGPKLDHKPLERGDIDIVDVVAALKQHSRGLQLTLEADYFPGGYGTKVAGTFGRGFETAKAAAISDLRLLCRAAGLIN